MVINMNIAMLLNLNAIIMSLQAVIKQQIYPCTLSLWLSLGLEPKIYQVYNNNICTKYSHKIQNTIIIEANKLVVIRNI